MAELTTPNYNNPNHFKYPSFEGLRTNAAWVGNCDYFIQEKIDGSQASFWIDDKGSLVVVNRGGEVSQSGMFSKIWLSIKQILNKLDPTLEYHGEYMMAKRHNIVTYERIPSRYVILYDISRKKFEDASEKWFTPEELKKEADRVGLESVPVLWRKSEAKEEKTAHQVCSELLKDMIDEKIVSVLGGPMEGFVVKMIRDKGVEKGSRLAKFVTKDFKEKHRKGLKDSEKKNFKGTIELTIVDIGRRWNTMARFRKAVIHLQERDVLKKEIENDEKTIQLLEEEMDKDFIKEGKEEAKVYLWGDLSGVVKRGARASFRNLYYLDFCKAELPAPVERKEGQPPPEDETKQTFYKEIAELGSPFDKRERFEKVMKSLPYPIEPANYSKMTVPLDEDLEDKSHEFMEQLWNLFGKRIMAEARFGLKDFLIETISKQDKV